jgi:hypothetical protein
MRECVLTIFGAVLIATSTIQIASATTRDHVHNLRHFRNANAAIVTLPDSPAGYSGVYSGGWSAPAGH